MYRQYENIADLQKRLEETKIYYNQMVQASRSWAPWDQRWDWFIDIHEDIADLEERINFAIQDEEADYYETY